MFLFHDDRQAQQCTGAHRPIVLTNQRRVGASTLVLCRIGRRAASQQPFSSFGGCAKGVLPDYIINTYFTICKKNVEQSVIFQFMKDFSASCMPVSVITWNAVSGIFLHDRTTPWRPFQSILFSSQDQVVLGHCNSTQGAVTTFSTSPWPHSTGPVTNHFFLFSLLMLGWPKPAQSILVLVGRNVITV